MLGGEDRALAVGGGRVGGTGSNSSNSMWGEGLEEVETLQRERDGSDSLTGTTDSSVPGRPVTPHDLLRVENMRVAVVNQLF